MTAAVGGRPDSQPPPAESDADGRGQSELFAVALLVAIVVFAATVMAVFGTATVDERQSHAAVGQAETGFAQLDARTSRVALGEATSQQVDLGGTAGDGTYATRPDAGWMRVSVRNASTGAPETTLANVTLGKVVYRNDGTTIAYQAGGVWRTDHGSATMLSRPELHFHEDTLTVPIIVTRGDGPIDGTVQIARAAPPDRRFPNRTANLTNRVSGVRVSITVHSEYYAAWARYFRATTNGYVQVDHDARTATLVFPSAGSGPSAFPSGIIATNGNGYLEFAGKGAYSDSYSSSEGPYTSPGDENGTVVAAGDIRTTGNSSVYGEVWSGSTVTLDGETSVSGDVYWTDDYEQNGAAVSGNNSSISGVASIEPIDGYVRERVDAVRAANDNDETSNITDAEMSISDDGGGGLPNGTLTAGSYYLERLNLSGERLILDTTDGNITIAVEEYVLLERGGQGNPGSNVTVRGDGVVRLFVASERTLLVEKSGHNNLDRDRNLALYVSIDSKVHVPGNRAPQFRVFGPREFTMAMAGSQDKPTYFNGYVYAPAGRDGPGYAYLKQAEMYGGVVAGNLTIGQHAAVHYDMALAERTIPPEDAISRLEFMHVTVHRVNVTSD